MNQHKLEGLQLPVDPRDALPKELQGATAADLALKANAADLLPKKSTVWIPATAMVARTTSGAAAGTVETATNKVMLATLDFDAAADEFAQFTVALPKSWNRGTLTARFCCTAAAGAQDKTVAWAIQGQVMVDDENIDAAFGAPVVAGVVTFGGVGNVVRWSPETAAFTLGGSTDDPSISFLQVFRDVSADNLAEDAKLIGVKLFFTENAHTDA
jgi:hypothetical protein